MKNETSFFIKGFKHTAFITLLSRISGFIRDIFIATFLGAGIFSDIFLIAFKLPNLFRRITAEGALTSAFLPIYTLLIQEKGKSFANDFFISFLIKAVFYLSLLLILFELFMPFVIYILAPGFANNDIVTTQIILLSRITIIFMPLISVVALLGVITNVSGRFWPIALTPIILNGCLIISCYFISDIDYLRSLPLAIASVLAGFLQLIFMIIIIKKFQIFRSKKDDYKNISNANKIDIKIYLKKTWIKFIPAAFGGGILQINILVDTILASLLGFGSVSYLYFADRIAQLPLGIIGIALSTSLLASLSKSIASKNIKQFSNQLLTSFEIGLFFSIPASFVLFFFPDIIISILFERGEFGLKEKNATIEALKAYSVGIPAFIILKSCQPAFLAEGNTKTPMYIGIVLLILNIILSLSLMNYFFHAGIALATSLSSWIGCLIYIILLIKNRKISLIKDKIYKKSISIFSILIFSLKLIMISSLMILIMKETLYYFSIYEINKFVSLIFLIFIGLLIYFLTCGVLRYIPEDLLKKRVSAGKERK
tara:strand:+ start:615 stop:2237 length:1623 start_codon:yes stop_codon:yes gene_type:complete